MADAWIGSIGEDALIEIHKKAEAEDWRKCGEKEWTFDDERRALDRLSELVGDWQGIPTSIPGIPVTLHDRHPLAPVYREIDATSAEPAEFHCSNQDVDDTERIVNSWFSSKRNATVFVYHRQGRAHVAVEPRSPDGSMQRMNMWLTTIGASDAWDMDAEYKAREKLQEILSPRQWRHYELTGSFFESSKKSDLIYVFRRLRPTVALSPRWPWMQRQLDEVRCLAILCLHPIGYYHGSWAGCMVPSDDVVAHVLAMRSDEAYFWRKANQHEAWRPEAGL